MQAFATSPNLITCWLAGPISSGYLAGPGWPWCFGTFSIIVPAVTLPLSGLFAYNYHQAKKQGLVPKRNSGRTAWQSLLHYCREFDAVGLILLSAASLFSSYHSIFIPYKVKDGALRLLFACWSSVSF